MRHSQTSILLVTLMLAACIPGCLFTSDSAMSKCSDDDNCLKIAFEVKEEYRNTDENPQKLADRLGELMGQEVEIYPVSSPGGWHIIGRTPLNLFDPNSEQPFIANPLDKIKFSSISKDEFLAFKRCLK